MWKNMSKDYMGTIKRFKGDKAQWKRLIKDYDIHKWVCGIEKKNGYWHLQIRIRMRDSPDPFEVLKYYFPDGHFEPCSDKWNYEKKDGRYWCGDDTVENRKMRFGKPFGWQNMCLDWLKMGNDRTIKVIANEQGGIGKSWLTGHLWEKGKAHVVQAQNTAKGLIQDCASEFIDNGWRPIVIIDIPRTWKWTDDIYVAIERIKDGIIKDTRYGSRTINIHGVIVLVMCNTAPDKRKLSSDRWDIWELNCCV